jgi:hypothetical protein
VWKTFVPGVEPAPFHECLYCEANLKDHHYVDIGSAVAGSEEQDFIDNSIDYHEWTRLPFSNAAAGEDTVVVFRAIRCPAGGGSIVPLVLAKDIADDDFIGGPVHRLGPGEIKIISESFGSWKPYSETWLAR